MPFSPQCLTSLDLIWLKYWHLNKMRSTVDGPPGIVVTTVSSSSNTNNNNNTNQMSNQENNGNSGSQYALCALGVGLVALGVVMIVWSLVPANTGFNNSSSGSGGDDGINGKRNKASSVAFVLAGSGVAMLLLSLCLGLRNKQREQLRRQEIQNQRDAAREQEERETWVYSACDLTSFYWWLCVDNRQMLDWSLFRAQKVFFLWEFFFIFS